MARPTDASPNPFVGYVTPSDPSEPLPEPLAGDEATLSDAPFSTPLITMVHPQDMASGLLDTLTHERERDIAARLDGAVQRTQLDTPHWHILHDRLRTTHGWKHQVDALFEGAVAAPLAGASTLVAIPAINPLLPGNPGQMLVYPFLNFLSVGAQGTTLTGLWSADVLVNNQVIPCGVFSGLFAGVVRPEMMGAVFAGNQDQGSILAQLRISVSAGATINAVSFYAQVALSFVYRFIDDMPSVRAHGRRGADESEWGDG